MDKKSGLIKNCLTCSKEFYVIRSQIEKRKYCCHNCSVKKGSCHSNFNGGLVNLNCLICEKGFFVKNSRHKKGTAKFCSIDCSNAYKRLNNSLYKKKENNCVCKNCNNSFYRKPSVIKKGQGLYCSKLCQSKHKSTTDIGSNNNNFKHGRSRERNFYKDTSSKWILRNKEKIRLYGKINKSKRRNSIGSFSSNQIKDLIRKQKYKCINCMVSVRLKYHIDHIIPIKLGGSNNIENIQILCPTCNLKKGAKNPIRWANENGRLL